LPAATQAACRTVWRERWEASHCVFEHEARLAFINIIEETWMNLTRYLLSPLIAVALLGALGASTSLSATSDSLYIGDASDNTIKHFDAETGQPLGVFVPTSAGLVGPRGILHVDRRLLVSNQNVNLKIPGEIDQFSIMDGTSLGALVPSTDPHAPFAPRGIILGPGPAGPGNSTLYVADFGKAKIGVFRHNHGSTYGLSTG
jgi:hypothetical protein